MIIVATIAAIDTADGLAGDVSDAGGSRRMDKRKRPRDFSEGR